MDVQRIYDVYIDYVRRESDLLQARSNWLYIGNAVLLAAVGFVVQEQLKIAEASGAVKTVESDVYTNTLYLLSRGTFIVAPTLGILFNLSIWSFMAAAVRAHHSIRLRWYEIQDRFPDETRDLPFLTFGFLDEGRKNGNSYWQCSGIPIACLIGWLAMLVASSWTAGVVYHVLPPLKG